MALAMLCFVGRFLLGIGVSFSLEVNLLDSL